MQIVDVIRGTSTKVRVRVAYNEAGRSAGLPERLIVKACFDETMRALCGPGNVTEATFYERIAPELAIEIPHCFFAAGDGSARQGVVLLEDLVTRGCRFGDASDSLELNTVRAVLAMQAALHARWWDRAIPSLDQFDRGGRIRAGAEFLISPENWDLHLSVEARRTILAELPPALRERTRIEHAVHAMLDGWQRPPSCTLHGDLHPGNLYYLTDGRPGLIDWQLWVGPWAHDVAYSVAGMLEPELRRSHERELLAYYLEQLAFHGIAPPSFSQAWLDYRRHMIWGFLWIACPPSMQPEHMVQRQASRFVNAAIDLETFEALKRV